MSELDRLADQHIRESAAQLQHVDELMAKAKQARAQRTLASEQESVLTRLEQQHSQASQDLQLLGGLPKPATADTVARSEGVKGVLQTIGLELEKTLAAVIGGNKG